MNLHKRIALSLALGTLLGLTAASAETVSKGNFTLPEQAYWGSSLLPAGNYSLDLVKESSGIRMVLVRGEGVQAIILAQSGDSETTTGRRCLKLENMNGTYVIRELDSGANGRAYTFAVPKAVRNMTLSSAVSQPVTVPITAAAGL